MKLTPILRPLFFALARHERLSMFSGMKTIRITCEFPTSYNAQPLGQKGQMSILTPEGPRSATITGRMNKLGEAADRKWEVELEYDETAQ